MNRKIGLGILIATMVVAGNGLFLSAAIAQDTSSTQGQPTEPGTDKNGLKFPQDTMKPYEAPSLSEYFSIFTEAYATR